MGRVQRRLLNFFAAVRNEAPQLKWTFVVITTNAEILTESMLASNGMPESWLMIISADVSCSFTGKFCSGFFTTQRTVSPRNAAFDILRESKSLVADVLAEFAKRLPDIR